MNDDTEMTEEDARFFLLAAYAAKCLGCLTEELDANLSDVTQENCGTDCWPEVVEGDFGITREGLLGRFQELVPQISPSTALVLMLHEAGCESPRDQLTRVFGDARGLDEWYSANQDVID